MTAPRDNSTPDVDLLAQQFFLWALATLRLPMERKDDGVCELVVPEDAREDFDGADTVRFAIDESTVADSTATEQLTLSSPLFDWTVARLQQMGNVVHAAPTGQPVSVRQLTSRLFDAYTVEDGNVRLGGCTLEDQPLLRYTYRIRSMSNQTGCRLAHVYASPEGRPFDDSLLSALRVDDLAPIEGKPPRVSGEDTRRWAATGKERAPIVSHDERAELLVVTVVWCKYFHCKLLFEINETRADLSFDGWAQLLVDRGIEPPPFQCPDTGRRSYRLLVMDDGRITVPEAIAACEQSGRQVLESDLVTCAASGQRVLPEFLQKCPVSEDRVLPSAMVTCPTCRQNVSPSCLTGDRCQACRTMTTIRADDPRMARVLGEHPRLDRWSRWRLAETDSSYILTATSMLRGLLLVLDKESLEATHLATGSRFGRRWVEVPREQRAEYLS
ncbi:MAG: hypothetical protein H8E44_42345 [Planctomycetes bacterium]|nr:hypothetical protein [Planctomycetota bacterium]MBL7041601.1 hypothetical protein [Pirellulaceae bacterium]